MNLTNPKDDPHAPHTSWWCDQKTREDFEQARAERDIHMRLSRAAKQVRPISLAYLTPRR